MTIYAIVNGLLSDTADAQAVRSHQDGTSPIWTLISPSGILQGGNPFFVPDFSERFEARTALALRIGKLGKGIAPRFVNRYVDATAPAVVFVAADMLKHLRTNGLPWTPAISYDRCLAIGKFKALDYTDILQSGCSLTLTAASPPEESTQICRRIDSGLEETIAALSRDNTLKTGDILLVGLTAQGPEITPGMRVRLELNGEPSLAFNIR